jgi:hypothetical protein
MAPLASVFRRLAAMVIFSFLLQAVASATTYYIDYASGNDSNNGTSKTTPWQHMPGMQGCTANCAKATPTAGDSIILKGGVTWPNAAFPITWAWSGSSGSPIYIGVDKTWYTGGSWSRPVFDSGGAVIAANPSQNSEVVIQSGASWITFDNIEFKGHYWTGTYGWTTNWTINASSVTDGTVIQNCYFHGWTHAAYSSGTTPDSYAVIMLGIYGTHNAVVNTTISNADGGSDSGVAVRSAYTVSGSTIHDVPNALLSGEVVIHDNDIYNITNDYDPTSHENAIESWIINGMGVSSMYIYNNVIHDTAAAVYSGIVANPNFGLAGTTSAYVFNNVLWNIGWGAQVSVDPTCTGPCTSPTNAQVYLWNNTMYGSSTNIGCVRVVNRSNGNIGVLNVQNNHCMTNSGTFVNFDSGMAANTYVNDNNLMMTTSTAATQGYATTNNFAPTSGSDSTVGYGVNLASNCSGNLTALCSDLLSVARGSTWDAGAYQYRAGSATAPAAPTSLSATVQ